MPVRIVSSRNPTISHCALGHSTKVVRTREKVSFLFGVMNVLVSALMLGMAPQCVVHERVLGAVLIKV